ncbi:MarR family transcriptional regulator [Acetobacterium woodii]|uniref:Transcriptional regulator n=1 Tax=Acetobacterium woodii (strain ATCC 29683 / DSM 1030 / JCM 2381 / KCTC 1655 / WB1) TaxID=931626 RepID=H6LET9_ACEWD|nr:MarR family transcriptional regulator [Acetobacterium woodii]AFA49382.1 transcriptional regulator [Acetobacterium woodii DSM 1030]
MKKEKKSKKPDVKEIKSSKKEVKKKITTEEKKVGTNVKKEKSVDQTTSDHQADLNLDDSAIKALMIDSSLIYQSILNLPQSFDVDATTYSLYPSELKALDMIGQFADINLTQLANKLGISKSAISKCTAKLLEKELITKEKSLINVREVVFSLTANGQTIFKQLQNVQDNLFEPFNQAMAKFTSAEMNELHRMFLSIHASLTEILNRA